METKTKEIFDHKVHACRPIYDMVELVNLIRRTIKSMSWGSRGWTRYPDDKALRFRVSGHLHKGLVFLTVNGSDLFDIHLTNLKGEIKETVKDVYIEDLIDTIDGKVERIPAYKH